MAQANQEDFLGEGAVDPFAGLAPAEDPSTQEAARRLALQRSATATANINNGVGGVNQFSGNSQTIDPKTGKPYTGRERPEPGSFTSGILPTLEAISKDPVTMGILLAPYGVLGAGAAVGGAAGLGFGEGTGSIAAANAGLAASESAAASAPAAVGYGAQSAPFMMASPSVAGAGGASAVPAVSGAAAPAAGMPWGDVARTALAVGAPIAVNELLGGRTKEEKALVAKQEQLAKEAEVRRGQQQDARMNALGQQLLAFNPTNQLMAQVFGPGAAFTPEQNAAMVQGPAPAYDESLTNYKGTDPKIQAKVEEYLRRKAEYDASEANRRSMMMNGTTPVGPAQPGIQMGAPQAARRY